MSKKSKPTENTEEEFQKFEDLNSAMEMQQKRIEELESSFLNKECPFRKEKCVQMKCAWFAICLNLNSKAFKEYFLK
jgi:hypothetical protein